MMVAVRGRPRCNRRAQHDHKRVFSHSVSYTHAFLLIRFHPSTRPLCWETWTHIWTWAMT